jgi:HK97 family phage portal protein
MFDWFRRTREGREATRLGRQLLAAHPGLRPELLRNLSLSQLRQFVYGPPTVAGVAVSEELAIGLTAVYRAVTLIASTIACLDAEVVQRVEGKGRIGKPTHWVSLLHGDPNDTQDAFKFWQTLVMHVCCSGNGFAEIERDELDRPIGLHIVHWRNVKIVVKDDGRVVYQLKKEGKEVPAEDMLHITTICWDGIVGISPIRAARETLGINVAAERYAGTVYGNGAAVRGFLKVSGVPTPETKANIRESWEIIHGGVENANKVGILGGDTEWVDTHMTPEDAQLLLSRTFGIEEVARIFGVPCNLLFSSNQSSYNSNDEANTQFYQLGLRSLIESIEAQVDKKLLTLEERRRGYCFKVRVQSILRTNFKAMVDAWTRLVLTGVATQDEAREALGMNPKGADALYMPVNMQISTDHKGDDVLTANLPGAAAAATATATAAEGGDVQATAMNGAQIEGLLSVIAQVSAGAIPLDSAQGILAASFPTLSARAHDGVTNAAREQALDEITRAFAAEIDRAHRRQLRGRPSAEQQGQYLREALGPIFRAYRAVRGQAVGLDDALAEFICRWTALCAEKPLESLTADDFLRLAA